MRLIFAFLFALLLPILSIAPVYPQGLEPTNLVHNGDFAQGMQGWQIGRGTKAEESGVAEVVAAQAGQLRQALRITARPNPGDPPWTVDLLQTINASLRQGDHITLKAWLRSPDSSRVTMHVQQAQVPYDKSLQQEYTLTPQWQEYEINDYSLEDFAPGTAEVGFWLAFTSGVVEITGVRMFTSRPQPQIDLRMGHGGTIQSVAVSADGSLVASDADDQTVKLWDTRAGRLRRSIKVGNQSARSVALSPDGKLVVNAGQGAVRRWDTRTGAMLPPLMAGQGVIYAVAFSPDGKMLAGSGQDKTIWLWEAQSGKLLRTLQGSSEAVFTLGFAADGKLLVSAGPHRARRGGLGVWLKNLASHELEKHKIRGGIALTGIVAGSPAEKVGLKPNDVIYKLDGKEFADGKQWQTEFYKREPGEQITLSVRREGQDIAVPVTLNEKTVVIGSEVRLWDTSTGALKKMLTEVSGNAGAIALSPDGKTILTGGDQNTLCLWDSQTGALKRTLSGSDKNIYRAAFTPDGKTVLGVTGMDIVLWDLQTGKFQQKRTEHNTVMQSIAISADGKTLASGGVDKVVRLLNPRTGEQQQMFGRDATVFSLALSPDGRTLAGASGEKVVLLWDVQSGVLKSTLPHTGMVKSVDYAPDSKLLASTGQESTIKIWNAQTGTLLRTMPLAMAARQVAFAPDGKSLVSGNDDGTIQLWNPHTGELLRTLTGHTNQVMTVAFAPDGQTLASGSMDGTLKLWNPHTGELIRSINGHTPAPQTTVSVAFSPDGKRLADWSNALSIRIWDTRTGTVEKTLKVEREIGCLRFSADSRQLVSSTYKRIDVWDVNSGMVERTLLGHSGWIWSLCFLRDSHLLARGGEEQIKVWDISDKWGLAGRELATLYALPTDPTVKALTADAKPLPADAKALTADAKPLIADARDAPNTEVAIPNDYLVTTPQGYYMGSAAADRYVQFRLGNDSFPAESFQARYYRPDLVKQALMGKELPSVNNLKGPVPPLLAFAASQKDMKVSGTTATVSVEASDDSGIKNIAFFINGARVDTKPITADARPLSADAKSLTAETRALSADARPIGADNKPVMVDGRDVPTAHQVTHRYTATLPLPRDGSSIKVQAIAFDDDGLQSPRDEMLFTRDKTAPILGKLLGLCVGISQYQDPRLKLRFADADATALSTALSQQRGLYSTVSVTALANEHATREAVKAALDKLIVKTTRDDTVMILLSGHGWRDAEGNFYFATHEVNRNDMQNTALAWSDVVQRLTLLSQKSKRVIVLLDACHSGSAATNEELVTAVLQAKAGVIVLASSKGDEVSLENREWGHGAFTKALLEGISGQAAEADAKAVTLWDFATYVRRRVSKLTEGAQNPQVPFLNDFDTDAAIVTKP